MVIDIHYHYFTLPRKKERAKEHMRHLMEDAKAGGVSKPEEEVFPIYEDYMNDVDGSKLVDRMQKNGYEKTVICVVDNSDEGKTDDEVLKMNEQCASVAAQHTGKLLSLASVDPRRPNAGALFRRCIEEFGMNGLKWHPDDGYYPNSLEAYRVLEVAEACSVPLLTHCCPLPHSRAKFAQPIQLDDVAYDFPKLDIIAAHMGMLWWRDWAALAQYKKNLHGDLALWQLTALVNPHLFRRYLREIIDMIGPEKVLFATDGPVFEPYICNAEWAGIIRSLTNEGDDGIVFTGEEVDAILGGNAARIFGIENDTAQ